MSTRTQDRIGATVIAALAIAATAVGAHRMTEDAAPVSHSYSVSVITGNSETDVRTVCGAYMTECAGPDSIAA